MTNPNNTVLAQNNNISSVVVGQIPVSNSTSFAHNNNSDGMSYSIDYSKPYYYVDEGELMESNSNDRNELRES